MGYLTTENVAPLTAVKASTWKNDRLGHRITDDAGREYMFVQVHPSMTGTAVSFGRLVGFHSGGSGFSNKQVLYSGGTSSVHFAGVAVNKDQVASQGQKFWICTRGELGLRTNSKLKSAQTPLTLWCYCTTDIGANDHLKFKRASGLAASALTGSGFHVIGMAYVADTSGKLTAGFIASKHV